MRFRAALNAGVTQSRKVIASIPDLNSIELLEEKAEISLCVRSRRIFFLLLPPLVGN